MSGGQQSLFLGGQTETLLSVGYSTPSAGYRLGFFFGGIIANAFWGNVQIEGIWTSDSPDPADLYVQFQGIRLPTFFTGITLQDGIGNFRTYRTINRTFFTAVGSTAWGFGTGSNRVYSLVDAGEIKQVYFF